MFSSPASAQAFITGYICIKKMKRVSDWRKPATRKQLFFKTNLLQEWMKKFVSLLTKRKGKTAMDEWENDDWHSSNFIKCIQKIRAIPFPYLLVNLFQ